MQKQNNTLNISIKDVGDGVYDSVVFVEANSFQLTGSLNRRAKSAGRGASYPDAPSQQTKAGPAAEEIDHKDSVIMGVAVGMAIGAAGALFAVALILMAGASSPLQVTCDLCNMRRQHEWRFPGLPRQFKVVYASCRASTWHCPQCGSEICGSQLTAVLDKIGSSQTSSSNREADSERC